MFLLRFGRGSGLTSPRRTMYSGCRRSTKAVKRERLIRPTGRRRARTRAGATGDSGSSAMTAFGWSLQRLLLRGHFTAPCGAHRLWMRIYFEMDIAGGKLRYGGVPKGTLTAWVSSAGETVTPFSSIPGVTLSIQPRTRVQSTSHLFVLFRSKVCILRGVWAVPVFLCVERIPFAFFFHLAAPVNIDSAV